MNIFSNIRKHNPDNIVVENYSECKHYQVLCVCEIKRDTLYYNNYLMYILLWPVKLNLNDDDAIDQKCCESTQPKNLYNYYYCYPCYRFSFYS